MPKAHENNFFKEFSWNMAHDFRRSRIRLLKKTFEIFNVYFQTVFFWQFGNGELVTGLACGQEDSNSSYIINQ